MDVLLVLLILGIIYVAGYLLDVVCEHNTFIGGILPYIGLRTDYYGPMEFRAWWAAWFWRGVCWNGIARPRRDI